MSTLSDEIIERSNGAATIRDAKDANGFDLVSMIADGRLPTPAIARTLGFTLDSVGNGEAVIVYELGESHYNPMGTVHGGLPATLIDSAAGAAIYTQLPPGYSFSTVSLTCEYFRAITAKTGPVRCVGQVVKRGRRISIADATVTDGNGIVYVRGTATCLAHPLR